MFHFSIKWGERKWGERSMALCLLALICMPVMAPGICDAQPKAYVVGPKDVITITIHAGGERQHQEDVTVSEQGMLNIPFLGPVKVTGLRLSELEKKISGDLERDYFVNPAVNLSIKEYHSLHYYISGAVEKPGLYETSSEVTLLELIAKAQGAIPDRGNVAYILRDAADEVMHGKKTGDLVSSATEPIKVDLQRLLDMGDMSVNLELKPGDVVYIPHGKALDMGTSKIYVEGEVKKPGVYDYQPGMTAMSACIMAGGFGLFAAPNRTRIIRTSEGQTEVIKINLEDVRSGKIEDVQLKSGDRIHVPETWL